ncbi:putative two-component system sensor kinase [Actinoplanes missouriensis 431]|uniref:histidine kinase n=1 Tax=Actinoplanes missouriensis (strain ATCC 14538 / DSM 43046 / CBS 188.64 / JCM 3121 / NBRC 102363 / NCIMB 12654 / NRRL B-3342 / UNCC 431) TaxID=512565 RepID=I0H4G8_ACTM4|nr:histidine kinase [Actinoplanes missouriensis]BAL87905.1 putative two-component system sensor kinase [Actinoplanes missouriensis 431]
MDRTELRKLAWLGAAATVPLVITATANAYLFELPVVIAFLVSAMQSAALPLALTRPWPATLLQFAAIGLCARFLPAYGEMWPLPVPLMILLIAHIGLVGLRSRWPVALSVWVAAALFSTGTALFGPGGQEEYTLATLGVYLTNSAFALLGALLWGQRTRVSRQLAEVRRDFAAEHAQRMIVEERSRIARELHDVVAHGMSVVHMQATSAPYRIKGLNVETVTEFKQIAAGTRSTMHEMRQLLAVLRDETADVPVRPASGLGDLGELAESARRGGVPVQMEISAALDASKIPDALGLVAYRIVQESLSNVIRHAPGAATRVTVTVGGGELLVEVANEEAPARAGAPPPVDAGERTGHGLAGMRERARLAGGTLTAGPLSTGGFRVAATLPLPSPVPRQEDGL